MFDQQQQQILDFLRDYGHYSYSVFAWLALWFAVKAYRSLPSNNPTPHQVQLFNLIMGYLQSPGWVNHLTNPHEKKGHNNHPQPLTMAQGPLYGNTIRSTTLPVVTISFASKPTYVCLNGENVSTDLTKAQCKIIGKAASRIYNQINTQRDNQAQIDAAAESVARVKRLCETSSHPVLSHLHDGSLVKGSAPDVFLVKKGVRHHIPDSNTFNALKLEWDGIKIFKDADLALIPQGEPIPVAAPPKPSPKA